MNANRSLQRVVLAAMVFATMSAADPLFAQEVVKANNTDSLNLGSSWVGGVVPTSSNIAVWTGTSGTTALTNVGGNIALQGIRLESSANATKINGYANTGSVTTNSSTDRISYTGTDFSNGQVVTFSSVTAGLSNSQRYYVTNIDTTSKTYQVALTRDGTAVNLTADASLSQTVRWNVTLGGSGLIAVKQFDFGDNLTTYSPTVLLDASQEWSAATNASIRSGNTNAAGIVIEHNGHTLTVSGSGDTYLGGFSGSGGRLIKNGAGTLALRPLAAGKYEFSEGLELNGGTINTRGSLPSTVFGTGTIALNGGVLHLGNSSSTVFGNAVKLGGATTLRNSVLTTNAAQNYTFGTLSIGSHVFTIEAPHGTNSGTTAFGATTLTGNATFDVISRQNNALSLGAIGESGGSRGLTKSGVGTLNISGASTYTGPTTISGGVLALTGAGAISTSSPIVNDGTLDITAITAASTMIGQLSGSGTVLIGGKTLTFSGSGDASFSGMITGSTGAITKQGEGFQTLSGANAYDGNTAISQGGLVIASTSSLPGWSVAGRFSVANGATLAVGNAVADADMATLAGTGNFAAGARLGFDTSAGHREYSPVIADTGNGALGLTKLGGNSLTLAGVNTFSGGLTVADGSLVIGSINNAGSNGVLGSGSSAVVLGSSGKQGTLSYTGATASSSRGFSAAAGGTAAFEVTDSASTLTLSGLIDGDGAKAFGGSGSFVISGGFSGAGGVFKTGAGAMTLAGPGHAGSFTITEGQLNINAANALGASSGSLSLGTGVSLDNTSGGLVTIGNSKPITLGSSLNFLGSNSLGMGGGTVMLSGNTAIDVAANALTFGGDVVGAGYGITKTGTGTLVLSRLTGTNSFTGNTHIQGGRLQLSGLSVLGGGSSTTVTIDQGAYLELGPTANVGNVTINMWTGGLITGTTVNASVTYTTSGTLTSSDGFVNGVQTIDSGVVISASADLLGTDPETPTAGRIVMQDNAHLRATTGFTMSVNKGIQLNSGTATFTSASGQFVLPNSISGVGALIKTGTGGFRLTGSNSYEGGTIVQQGTFGIASDASLGAVTGRLLLDGGTLNSAQDSTSATINATRQVVLANGKTSGIDANPGGTLIYASSIIEDDPLGAQVGSLRIGTAGRRDGTVILAGANTYRGSTTVEAGTLVVNGSLAAGGLTVQPGATLMGAGSIAGTTTISGMHRPGNSPGIQTFSNLTYSGSTAAVTWELWGNTTSNSPLAYDQINVTSDLTFADPTALYLAFTGTGSSVNWADAFWDQSRSWVLYSVDGTTTGFGDLSLVVQDWQDGETSPQSFNTVRPNSLFTLQQSGNDVVVAYTIIVPEPSTAAIAGIGIGLAVWSLSKRRRHISSPS